MAVDGVILPVLDKGGARFNAHAYGLSSTSTGTANTAVLSTLVGVAHARGGGIVEITRPGSYAISPLTLADGVELVGAPGVKLVPTGLASGEAAVGGTSLIGAAVRRIEIAFPAQASANEHGVLFDGCSYCTVDEVVVRDADRGVWFNDDAGTGNVGNTVNNTKVFGSFGFSFLYEQSEDCAWVNCIADGARGQDGFKTTGAQAGMVTKRVKIIGCTSKNNARDGFDLFDGFVESTIVGNIAYANAFHGFDIKGNAAVGVVDRDSTVVGNVAVENTLNGFSLQALRFVQFTGNVAVKNGECGFFLNGVRHCIFGDNLARANTQHGWHLAQSGRNTFSACHGIDNSYVDGTTQNGTYDGWFVEDSSSVNEFDECTGTNSLSVPGHVGGQRYGMNIDTSTSFGNRISGFFAPSNVTDALGGTSLYTTQVIVSHLDNTGTWRGMQSISATRHGVQTTNANAEVAANRTDGAQVLMQAQATLGLLTTIGNFPLRFGVNGTAWWELSTSGHIVPVTDGVPNIGSASRRVGALFTNMLRATVLAAEPSSPADGMLVYADGATWDPGSGAGFYGRENGAWVKL